jgi:hypothetical protein
MSKFHRLAAAAIVAGMVAPAARAQFNNPWVTFVLDNNRIQNPNGTVATQVTNDTEEKDYAWGDLDKNGWTDVVVVRKEIAATLGKRESQLLMNENGILVDRTSTHAVDSDIPGDMGFKTPRNDRDVQIIDLDGDTWPDVVTATTLSDGDPKHLSHPRVFRNKGSINGVWQGLKYEDARFPQLRVIGSNLAVAPRFCSVSVGDVTGDGSPDLYFADYDDTETFINEPSSWDLNDRLLINDGNGYFTDSLQTRMTGTMLLSAFGMASDIEDMNGDGLKDVVKATALGSPQRVSVAYHNPAAIGTMNLFQNNAGSGQPYHIDVGDLNNDGKLDLVVGDDGTDYYRYNTGNDSLGRVIWGPNRTFNMLDGIPDDGFPGNTIIQDLNDDGWGDVLVADVDVDVPGCDRRAHIYHNPGGAIGAEITLRQECQNSGPSGWKGVVGMQVPDLRGTYDFAVFDIDNDGDIDLIMGRCTGTFVWMNQLYQPATTSLYCFGDGTGTACPCANTSAAADKEGCLHSLGTGGRLRTSGIARITEDTFRLDGSRMPNSSALYFQGTTQANGGAGAVFGDGLRCVAGGVVRLGTQTNVNGASIYPEVGDTAVSVASALTAGATRNYQVWFRNAAAFCNAETFNLTNGASVVWAP